MVYKDLIEVEILAISVSSQIPSNGFVLLLKEIDGERRLPIIIGQFEAQAITFEIEQLKPPRPLTHDLLKNIIENLGYQISNVTITDLIDGTFYAKIKFDAIEIDEIDARPSDAVAIALKFGAPIFVTSKVMNEVAYLPVKDDKSNIESDLSSESDSNDFFDNEDDFNEKDSISKKEEILKNLKADLEEAVNNEDYEKAAQLRDEIKKIEISNLN